MLNVFNPYKPPVQISSQPQRRSILNKLNKNVIRDDKFDNVFGFTSKVQSANTVKQVMQNMQGYFDSESQESKNSLFTAFVRKGVPIQNLPDDLKNDRATNIMSKKGRYKTVLV